MIKIALVLCVCWLIMTAITAFGVEGFPKEGAGRPVSPNKDSNQEPERPAEISAPAPTPADRVSVYKPDGSLQCALGGAVSLDEMARELKNLTIYRSEKRMDGLVRIMQCGTPTGMCNVYEIDRACLQEAIRLGFREWTF